jgi:transcriptional/translational regulatory protein YebC/TACO1
LERVKKELLAKKYEIENTEHVFIPNVEIQLNEMERNTYEKMKQKLRNDKLLDEIYDNVEDLEDEVDEVERKKTKN